MTSNKIFSYSAREFKKVLNNFFFARTRNINRNPYLTQVFSIFVLAIANFKARVCFCHKHMNYCPFQYAFFFNKQLCFYICQKSKQTKSIKFLKTSFVQNMALETDISLSKIVVYVVLFFERTKTLFQQHNLDEITSKFGDSM